MTSTGIVYRLGGAEIDSEGRVFRGPVLCHADFVALHDRSGAIPRQLFRGDATEGARNKHIVT